MMRTEKDQEALEQEALEWVRQASVHGFPLGSPQTPPVPDSRGRVTIWSRTPSEEGALCQRITGYLVGNAYVVHKSVLPRDKGWVITHVATGTRVIRRELTPERDLVVYGVEKTKARIVARAEMLPPLLTDVFFDHEVSTKDVMAIYDALAL